MRNLIGFILGIAIFGLLITPTACANDEIEKVDKLNDVIINDVLPPTTLVATFEDGEELLTVGRIHKIKVDGQYYLIAIKNSRIAMVKHEPKDSIK